MIEQIPVYIPGKPIEETLKEYGVGSAIKLASNENPLGYSPKVKEVLENHLSQLYFYPDAKASLLRDQLSSFLNISGDQLIFGAGGEDLIQMVAAAFLESGFNSVMSSHTFPNYKINTMIEGAEVREVPEIDGCHDLLGMSQSIDDNTRIVWVCNPNNPTGTYINEQKLISFLDTIPKDILIVLDEAYYEFATAPDYPQAISLMEQYPNLFIIRTFSKAYGLAGLRIGYGIAHPNIIRILNRVRKPFNTSYLAQIAAIAALSDQDFVRKTVESNAKELDYYYEQFNRLQIPFYHSQTNFIYINLSKPVSQLYERLLSHGVIIRPIHPHSLRVSIGLREQNICFFEAFETVLHEV